MESPAIEQLDRDGITDHHRVAIAHCVMEWAKCEGLLRALLSALEGRSLDEGAQNYRRLAPEDAWQKIKRSMRGRGATEAVLDAIQTNRSHSKKFYETRKIIVHSGCLGVWQQDPSFILFAPFESQNQGEMTLYWVPIDELARSASFARAASKLAHRLLTSLGY